MENQPVQITSDSLPNQNIQKNEHPLVFITCGFIALGIILFSYLTVIHEFLKLQQTLHEPQNLLITYLPFLLVFIAVGQILYGVLLLRKQRISAKTNRTILIASLILYSVGFPLLFISTVSSIYKTLGSIGSEKETVPSITQSPTPTPDLYREPTGSAATANWKMYTSTSYGYSIKYPEILTYSTSTYQGRWGIVNTDTWNIQDKSYAITVFSYKSGVNTKLEFNLQPQPIQTIQLASQTVNKVISVDETLVQIGPFKKGDNEYMIVYTSGTQKSFQGLSLFNQILSTFKFTDQNQ